MQVTYPRATFFGLSAGMGKVGALIGSASFSSIQSAVGLDGVYYVCAGVSLLGAIVTVVFIPPPSEVRTIPALPPPHHSPHTHTTHHHFHTSHHQFPPTHTTTPTQPPGACGVDQRDR